MSYEVFDDGLYVADHVLGPGRLRIGDSETEWTVGRPKRAWTWKTRAVVGGMFAAVGGSAGAGDGAMRAWVLALAGVLALGASSPRLLRRRGFAHPPGRRTRRSGCRRGCGT